MGQWLVQWTPTRDHCIVFVLSWCLSSPRCINGYCYRRGGRRCSGSNLNRCPFICLFIYSSIYSFIYLFMYFSHSLPMQWSHLKLPLQGPSQPHLSCFVYIHEFRYYILFRAYRSKQNPCETTKYTYFQGHTFTIQYQ